MAQGEKFSLVATGSLGDGLGSRPGSKVYLCYSHEDRLLVERFVRHLQVVAKYKGFTFWWDRNLEEGSQFHSEIGRAIDGASLVLVLVSTGLLSSSYVSDYELPRMLGREAHGLRIIPVLLRSCPWQACPWLDGRHMYTKMGGPLDVGTEAEIEEEFSQLALKVFAWLSIRPDPDGDAPAGLPRPKLSDHNADALQDAKVLLAKDRFGWKGLADYWLWVLSTCGMLMPANKVSPGRFDSGTAKRLHIYLDNSGSMSPAPLHFMGHGVVTDDTKQVFKLLNQHVLYSGYHDASSYVYTSGVRVHTCYDGLYKGSRSREAELIPLNRPQSGVPSDELSTLGADLYQAIFGFSTRKIDVHRLQRLELRESLPSELLLKPRQSQVLVTGGGNVSVREYLDRLKPLSLDTASVARNVSDLLANGHARRGSESEEPNKQEDPGTFCRPYLWDFINQGEWSGASGGASGNEDERVAQGDEQKMLLVGGWAGGVGIIASNFLRCIEPGVIEKKESFMLTCAKSLHDFSTIRSNKCFEVDRYVAGSSAHRLLQQQSAFASVPDAGMIEPAAGFSVIKSQGMTVLATVFLDGQGKLMTLGIKKNNEKGRPVAFQRTIFPNRSSKIEDSEAVTLATAVARFEFNPAIQGGEFTDRRRYLWLEG